MDVVKGLSKHHSKRRFRFQKFQERVADVRVDISREVLPVHEIDAKDAAAGDDIVHRHCITQEELAKLREMDLSKDFVAFADQIEELCLSLPILINNLDLITKILADHLKLGADTDAERRAAKPNNATSSVLKIIVAVSKDCQHALLPHADTIVAACFGILASDGCCQI